MFLFRNYGTYNVPCHSANDRGRRGRWDCGNESERKGKMGEEIATSFSEGRQAMLQWATSTFLNLDWKSPCSQHISKKWKALYESANANRCIGGENWGISHFACGFQQACDFLSAIGIINLGKSNMKVVYE